MTLEKRFKRWNAALQSAGCDPSKARLTYDDLELLEELRRVARLIGETPNTTKFAEQSEMSISTITRRFGGSWEGACRAAGLIPPKKTVPTNLIGGWNKGQTKIRISANELRYLYERGTFSILYRSSLRSLRTDNCTSSSTIRNSNSTAYLFHAPRDHDRNPHVR